MFTVSCARYSVRRAALVPHQQPNLRSGQPMGSTLHQVNVGTSTAAALGDPREVKGANAGVAVPRWQLNGAYRFQANPNLDIGFVVDWGLDKGSKAVNDDQPDPDYGDVRGGGLSFHYSAYGGPNFRLGVTADLLLYSVPYVEYRTCIEFCAGGMFTDIERDRDLIPVASFGLIPSWRLADGWVAFGGVNLRNHPTVRKGDIEQLDLNDDEEVEAGPGNIVASGGVEVGADGGFKAMFYIYQPVYADPVRYGPTVGFGLTIPLVGRNPAGSGRLPRHAGPAAPAPPPPLTAPPAPGQTAPGR